MRIAAPPLQLSLQFADARHRESLPRHRVARWIRAALEAPAQITVRVVDEAEGQTGYCVLPDGRRVEEWALFRASQAEEEATSGMPVSRGSKADAKQ